jgi:hypothetical protein
VRSTFTTWPPRPRAWCWRCVCPCLHCASFRPRPVVRVRACGRALQTLVVLRVSVTLPSEKKTRSDVKEAVTGPTVETAFVKETVMETVVLETRQFLPPRSRNRNQPDKDTNPCTDESHAQNPPPPPPCSQRRPQACNDSSMDSRLYYCCVSYISIAIACRLSRAKRAQSGVVYKVLSSRQARILRWLMWSNVESELHV